jgi:hypothetical protein
LIKPSDHVYRSESTASLRYLGSLFYYMILIPYSGRIAISVVCCISPGDLKCGNKTFRAEINTTSRRHSVLSACLSLKLTAMKLLGSFTLTEVSSFIRLDNVSEGIIRVKFRFERLNNSLPVLMRSQTPAGSASNRVPRVQLHI